MYLRSNSHMHGVFFFLKFKWLKIKDAYFLKPFMQFLSRAEIVLSYNRMGGQKDTAVREEDVAKLLLAAIRRFHHHARGLLAISGN